jgi:hypothetical protein
MPDPGSGLSADLDLFKAGWACPVLWTVNQYLDGFQAAGLSLEIDLDLTAAVCPRTPTQVRRLERLNRLAGVLPFPRWRQVVASYRGGLALERLYQRGAMTYRLLIARPRKGLAAGPMRIVSA